MRGAIRPSFARVLAGASIGALLVGCYHPRIGDESLTCGPEGLCPEGFVCNAAQLCAKKSDSTDGGSSAVPIYSGKLHTPDLSTATGTLECSTKTGAITLVGTDMTELVVVAPGADGFVRVAQTSGPPLGVWSFDTLTVPSTVTIKPTSDSDAMPVFAASGAITMGASIVWRGYGGFHGLAGAGGQGRDTGVFFSGGEGGVNGGGGGGAGYGGAGSMGLGTGAGAGGLAYGTSDLTILHAGSGGGGGGSVSSADAGVGGTDAGVGAIGGVGGNGGGAVALLSLTSIALSGPIDVSGEDGTSGGMNCGGGGGGSGGSILLSAPALVLHAGHALTALGGAGAAGIGAGGEGGGGAVGRIYLAGTVTVDEMLNAQPMVATATIPATSFPIGGVVVR